MALPERSVITGTSVLSPLGDKIDDVFEALLHRESGLSYMDSNAGESMQAIGAVDDALIRSDAMPSRLRRHSDRSTHLAVTSFMSLVEMLNIEVASDLNPEPFGSPQVRVAVVWGSSSGTPSTIQKAYGAYSNGDTANLKRRAPLSAVYGSPSATTAVLADLAGARGPSMTINTECASSTTAVGLASMLVETGMADIVLCGGSDATLDAFSLAQVRLLGATHSRAFESAAYCSRPFDQERCGFVPAEGATAMLIESRTHAEKCGRTPIASIYGYGMTTNGGHLTQPDQDAAGVRVALQTTMDMARANPEDVVLYSAHGTGTLQNDPLELEALKSVLGAGRFGRAPIQAIKGNMGHTLAAAGGIEIAIALESLRRGMTPPIANCENPIDKHAGLVTGEGCEVDSGLALSCSSGFGGSNAAVLVG